MNYKDVYQATAPINLLFEGTFPLFDVFQVSFSNNLNNEIDLKTMLLLGKKTRPRNKYILRIALVFVLFHSDIH